MPATLHRNQRLLTCIAFINTYITNTPSHRHTKTCGRLSHRNKHTHTHTHTHPHTTRRRSAKPATRPRFTRPRPTCLCSGPLRRGPHPELHPLRQPRRRHHQEGGPRREEHAVVGRRQHPPPEERRRGAVFGGEVVLVGHAGLKKGIRRIFKTKQ